VDWILDKIVENGRQRITTNNLVLWKPYTLSDETWEPASNFKNSPETVMKFEELSEEGKFIRIEHINSTLA
jgi:hypothetical protein